MSFAPETETLAKPEALIRVPVGLASPLWGLFAGAAMTGATWWWMTRWARPQNLEALFGAAEAAIEPEVAVLAAPAAEAIEMVVDSTPEPVVESMVETTAEPAMEALVEATPEPIVEALTERTAEPTPTPKPKSKAAAPQMAPKAD